MTSPSAASASTRGRRRSGQLSALAAFGSLLVASHAHAQLGERIELTWQAPAGCPRADDVRARIRELAGGASTDGSQLRAEATVTRDRDGRFHLKLIVHAADATGERHIEGRSCEDLAGAAAVNLVLLLGSSQPPAADSAAPSKRSDGDDAPHAQERPPPPSAADPEDAAEPQTEASPAPAASAPEGESSPSNVRPLLRIPFASLSIGPLPRPSFGVALGAGVRLGSWSVLAEAAAWLQQTVPSPTRAGVSADVDHIDASLRACYKFAWPSVEVAPCVSASLRHVWVSGAGTYVTARTAESTWIAPGIGVELGLPLSKWLSLIARIDAQLETSHPRISIDGVGELDQLAPASFAFAVGAEWVL